MEADVEKLIEKGIDQKTQKPDKKTRYQIKSEEKRKNKELRHRQQLQWVLVLIGIVVLFLIIGIVASILNI